MKIPRKIWGGLGNQMFQFAYIFAQRERGEIPDIYVQDEKYFEEFKDQVKAMYGVEFYEPAKEYISLHIRRGDYIGNSFYVDLTKTDYYDWAIAEFPNEKFLVFCADRQTGSDDEKDKIWCDGFLKSKGIQYEFCHSNNEIDDLNAMASCKGHIMANSSFSWWASYLGGGKVVAPKEWFSDGITRITLPKEWLKF